MIRNKSIAKAVVTLSLDVMRQFYDEIGILKYQDEIHQLFQKIVKTVNKDVLFSNQVLEEHYGWGTYGEIFATLTDETNKLPEDMASYLRSWFWNAYSGQTCSDLSLSAWYDALNRWGGSGFHEDGASDGYSEAEYNIVTRFLNEFRNSTDLTKFCNEVDNVIEKERLTAYDSELHRLYEYNYYDMVDPFVLIRFLIKGYKLRLLVKHSEILKSPDFPFEKLHASVMKLLEGDISWGFKFIQDIRTITEFRKEEYRC